MAANRSEAARKGWVKRRRGRGVLGAIRRAGTAVANRFNKQRNIDQSTRRIQNDIRMDQKKKAAKENPTAQRKQMSRKMTGMSRRRTATAAAGISSRKKSRRMRRNKRLKVT